MADESEAPQTWKLEITFVGNRPSWSLDDDAGVLAALMALAPPVKIFERFVDGKMTKLVFGKKKP